MLREQYATPVLWDSGTLTFGEYRLLPVPREREGEPASP